MSNGNRPSDDQRFTEEVYPVYVREPAPNWLLMAIVAAVIYWIMASYFGH